VDIGDHQVRALLVVQGDVSAPLSTLDHSVIVYF
jgi:hypothetical protein